MEELQGMEPVFGIASGRVEGRESSAFLPLVFRLYARDSRHLHFVVSDFHDNTWEATRTIEQLEDMRDEVGIGGSWSDFINYVRAAFLSGNVQLVLGGPANALGGQGATSGKIIAIKSKHNPKVTFQLTRVTAADAQDRMGDVAVHTCRGWQESASSFVAEQALVSKLRAELEAEKLKVLSLEEKLDMMSGGKKRYAKEAPVSDPLHPEQPAKKAKTKTHRVAPISSRTKGKGLRLAEDELRPV